jgi:hypothetical protein
MIFILIVFGASWASRFTAWQSIQLLEAPKVVAFVCETVGEMTVSVPRALHRIFCLKS